MGKQLRPHPVDLSIALSLQFLGTRCLIRRGCEVRRVEVVFAGDTDQHEHGIAPGISQRRSIRCGVAVSLMAQTGQSEAIHSPDACASCFPNDVRALIKTAQDHEAPLRILEAVAAANDTRRRSLEYASATS